jgi:hypothetical protein
MAPKKNRKQASETRPEEPVEDLVAPPETIGEEEPSSREDQDEPEGGPESEEEQRSSVLFTLKQLEVLLKMNRPDFGELVAALKTGTSKGERFQPAKPGNFNGARDRKVVDAWLTEMEDYIHAAKIGRHSIASEDRYKTTFAIDWGTFVWVVMPFGVKNGPPTYQRVVTKAFREYIDVFMKIFLDDFTIFNDLSTHLEKLNKCFLKCKEYGISLNPKKCAFMICSQTI